MTVRREVIGEAQRLAKEAVETYDPDWGIEGPDIATYITDCVADGLLIFIRQKILSAGLDLSAGADVKAVRLSEPEERAYWLGYGSGITDLLSEMFGLTCTTRGPSGDRG